MSLALATARALIVVVRSSELTTYITTELSFPTNRICTKLVFLNPDSPICGLDTDEHIPPQRSGRKFDEQFSIGFIQRNERSFDRIVTMVSECALIGIQSVRSGAHTFVAGPYNIIEIHIVQSRKEPTPE